MNKIVGALALFLATSHLSTSAFAGSSGWINAHDLERFHSKTLRRGKQMPTSIKCKNNNVVTGMSRKNTLVKVGYKPLAKNIKWQWSWGAHVGVFAAKAKKKGYKLISSGSFRRPSGLLIRCAIWHKKV